MNQICTLERNINLYEKLKEIPYYAKKTEAGLMAIIATAYSLSLDPMQALGGLLYFVNGKVEMSSRGMNMLIRKHKHNVKFIELNEKICILKGIRKDNGDECTAQFTIEEAKKIGLTSSLAWKNYAEDMLFARALSRLGRRLFPDVIGDCYVEGEIDEEKLNDPKYALESDIIIDERKEEIKKEPPKKVLLSDEDVELLFNQISEMFHEEIVHHELLKDYIYEKRLKLLPTVEANIKWVSTHRKNFVEGYDRWLNQKS